MNKTAVSLLLLAAAALTGLHFSNQPYQAELEQFLEWQQKLGFNFQDNEFTYRFQVFADNYRRVNEHNSKLGKKHEEALNQFAFLTPEEFRAKYLSEFPTANKNIKVEEPSVTGPTIDWVSFGAVSPVKNQGSCGATYAFSAVGAIEGVSVIFYKNQQEYSVQQIIDCSQPYGNNGCVTGNMVNVFNYVRDKGINTWASYPFSGALGSCRTASGLFRIAGQANVTDCGVLATALTARPVSVAVDGNNFQFYKSGVFYNCGTNLSLAVLLVGMTDSYWTLKNSWGTTWGEGGYIRINRGNACGVCQAGSYPIVN